MKRGATKDYKFGSKNHWRRTLWNEILSRTNGREREMPILYLAGADDLDRRIAVEKGVPHDNLIAVEGDPGVAASLRKRGVPVIEGDLGDVLWSWPKHRPVAAVVADYCSGLTWNVLGLYDCFERGPLRDCVIAANFMRGRDPHFTPFRECMIEARLLLPLWQGGPANGEPALVADVKHRGYLFAFYHAFDTLQVLADAGSATLERVDTSKKKSEDWDGRVRVVLPADEAQRIKWLAGISRLMSDMAPRFLTYRSTSGQVFDSVVLWHLVHGTPPTIRAVMDVKDASLAWREKVYRAPALVRSIAARLAIRTQRLTGQLPARATR